MKYLKNFSSILSVFALLLAFSLTFNSAYAQVESGNQEENGDVVEVINESEDHTVFASLLEETNLSDAISDQGPYTIIAPTDEAFESMEGDLDQLREDPDQLQNIVIGHLFQGEVPAADAEPTLGVEIKEGDIQASNGLVHVTDQVIEQ